MVSGFLINSNLDIGWNVFDIYNDDSLFKFYLVTHVEDVALPHVQELENAGVVENNRTCRCCVTSVSLTDITEVISYTWSVNSLVIME